MVNKLQIYDRVRVRGTNYKGDIVNIYNDKCLINYPSDFSCTEYHHEQLIKLNKKQRLEGWANLYKGKGILYRTKEEAAETGRLSQNYIRTVKMREVKE